MKKRSLRPRCSDSAGPLCPVAIGAGPPPPCPRVPGDGRGTPRCSPAGLAPAGSPPRGLGVTSAPATPMLSPGELGTVTAEVTVSAVAVPGSEHSLGAVCSIIKPHFSLSPPQSLLNPRLPPSEPFRAGLGVSFFHERWKALTVDGQRRRCSTTTALSPCPKVLLRCQRGPESSCCIQNKSSLRPRVRIKCGTRLRNEH